MPDGFAEGSDKKSEMVFMYFCRNRVSFGVVCLFCADACSMCVGTQAFSVAMQAERALVGVNVS